MFKTKHHCLSFELFRSISVSTKRDIVRKDIVKIKIKLR